MEKIQEILLIEADKLANTADVMPENIKQYRDRTYARLRDMVMISITGITKEVLERLPPYPKNNEGTKEEGYHEAIDNLLEILEVRNSNEESNA